MILTYTLVGVVVLVLLLPLLLLLILPIGVVIVVIIGGGVLLLLLLHKTLTDRMCPLRIPTSGRSSNFFMSRLYSKSISQKFSLLWTMDYL